MSYFAPLALTSVTAALLALPVTPALYELWKRRDAAPLPTSGHDGRIENFAEAFRSRVQPFHAQLARCRVAREVSRISVDGTEVLLVGREHFDFDAARIEKLDAIMLAQAAALPGGLVVNAGVYAESVLRLGEGAALRAGMGTGDIFLGKDSLVLRWLHSDSRIYMRQNSSVYGRLSAKRSIRLETGCGFERMHAPLIITADPDQGSVGFSSDHSCQTRAEEEILPADVSNVFTSSRPRLRIEGDFVLPAGETLNANVIATGALSIGPGARLFGCAKSYKDTGVEENACVHGSIVCGENIHLGRGSFAAGPILAEGDVRIASGSLIGTIDAPATISSRRIQIAAGCRLHGTVWARVRGIVEG